MVCPNCWASKMEDIRARKSLKKLLKDLAYKAQKSENKNKF